MDLPSSKFSWHERSISERSGSCPSSGAINSGGSDPSSPIKNRQRTMHQPWWLSGVCQVLNIIILCLITYLDYFWCIKYKYMHLYMKIVKEKGEKEKGKRVLDRWARGDFGPAERGPICQRGGLALAEAGGYGGRVNLVGECSGRPVHGEVAGSRGGLPWR
jgi:hypothetical protein